MNDACGRSVGWRRFALATGVAVFILVPLQDTAIYARATAPVARLTARAATALLGATGVMVARQGTLLEHPEGFAYIVGPNCTGVVLAAVLAVGLLAAPTRPRRPVLLMLLGLALISTLNQLRLVALFQIGVSHPEVFDLAHDVVGESLMVALVMALWSWLLPAPRPRSSCQKPAQGRGRTVREEVLWRPQPLHPGT